MTEPPEIRDLGLSGIAIPLNRMRALREEVVGTLMQSMHDNGLLHPIVVRPRGGIGYILVAGRHRYEAALRLQWPAIRATIVEGMDEVHARLAEIDENLARADLGPAETASHIDERKICYIDIHKETKHGGAPPNKQKGSKGGKAPKEGKDDSLSSLPEDPAFTEDTAKKTNQSRRTVERAAKRAKAIPDVAALANTSLDKGEELDALIKLQELDPDKAKELREQAIAGKKVSAKAALKQTQRAKKEEEVAKKIITINEQQHIELYGVIYADPPWDLKPYSRVTGMDRHPANHYPVMSLGDIKAVKVPAAEDAVLFLWATTPMLPQALEVMQAWGFDYKSHCVWVKPHAGTGYWFRSRHELLLVGTRGNLPAPAPGEQYDSVIEVPGGSHSTKPEAFAEMIEHLFQNMPVIELFARKARLGWATWGAEAA